MVLFGLGCEEAEVSTAESVTRKRAFLNQAHNGAWFKRGDGKVTPSIVRSA